MSKRSYSIYSASLQLREPINLAFGPLVFRSALYIHLRDEDGVEGWGEASPLPGFSREFDREALDRLEMVARLWCSRFPNPLLTVRTPSVCFGFEQALRHLEVNRSGRELHQLSSDAARDQVRICALLTGDSPERMAAGVRSGLAGYRTIKIKVGRLPVPLEADLVKRLCADLAPGVRVRLDANRAWALEDAVAFSKAVEGLPIDFIEEPLRNPIALPAFHAQSRMPVALDETLMELPPGQWAKLPGVRAVVLKPTLLGGFSSCRTQASAARSIGADVVVSSAFESGVGTWGCAALAAELQEPDTAAGLDPYRMLGEDVLAERFDFVNGTFYMAGVRLMELRREILKELRHG